MSLILIKLRLICFAHYRPHDPGINHHRANNIQEVVGSIPIGSTRHRSRPLGENEACHGVAKGEAGHPRPRLYQVENYALASQSEDYRR